MTLLCILEARGSGHHRWGAPGLGLSQKQTDSTGFKRQLYEESTLAGLSDPTTGQPDSSFLLVQGWDKSPSLEVGGNKVRITFFSFSLVSSLCSVEVYLTEVCARPQCTTN